MRKLARTIRWLGSRFSPRVPILLYHRVAELPTDPQLLCVTPDNFAEHLVILRKHFHPIQLNQLIVGLVEKNIPEKSVIVTFDDGYADNLYLAKPMLVKYDICATVFITSGYIGQEREFWWDELDRLLLQPTTLPEILRIDLINGSYVWTLGEAANYTKETFDRHRHWNVLVKSDPSPRQIIYRQLCQILRPLSEKERHKILDNLLLWAGIDSKGRHTHRILSPEEVVRLEEGGLIEVGAHTMTHPVLSKIPEEEQLSEIQGSKVFLEEILAHPLRGFSYPYGCPSDYSLGTLKLVKSAGFAYACANFPEVAERWSDRWQLPRFLVRNWDGEEFSRHLSRWVS